MGTEQIKSNRLKMGYLKNVGIYITQKNQLKKMKMFAFQFVRNCGHKDAMSQMLKYIPLFKEGIKF